MNQIQLSGTIIIKNGKLLLLFKKNEKYYEFPGGKVEPNEEIVDAAIRETKEEIGCDVTIKKVWDTKILKLKEINTEAICSTCY